MSTTPRLPGFDHSAALRADPYGFIASAARELGSDVFECRVLLRKTLCLTGPDAARLFYDPSRFQRSGAMPEPIRATLLGRHGVQNLDGETHRARKALFLSYTVPAAIGGLLERVEAGWLAAAAGWAERGGDVHLYDAMQPVLARAVCDWAGVPLPERDVARRTAELVSLFDDAGNVGIGHLRSRLSRRRASAWIAGLVRRHRAGERMFPVGSAAHGFATFADPDGRTPSPTAAAEEILNLLRPTVAVAVYLVFVAHALHEHPAWRERLRHATDAGDAERFVQEVRRFYPFFPSVAAVTRCGFEWRGHRFEKGARVLLDLHGTNHDPRAWPNPETFDPDRYRSRAICPFNHVPQGGGDHATGHRCPGEWLTIELMRLAVDIFANRLDYAVPPQDLRIDTLRLPALPRSGMVLRDVRVRTSGAAVREPAGHRAEPGA